MSDQDLYSGASWEFERQQSCYDNREEEILESIALKNAYFEEALTDLINQSYEYGE